MKKTFLLFALMVIAATNESAQNVYIEGGHFSAQKTQYTIQHSSRSAFIGKTVTAPGIRFQSRLISGDGADKIYGYYVEVEIPDALRVVWQSPVAYFPADGQVHTFDQFWNGRTQDNQSLSRQRVIFHTYIEQIPDIIIDNATPLIAALNAAMQAVVDGNEGVDLSIIQTIINEPTGYVTLTGIDKQTIYDVVQGWLNNPAIIANNGTALSELQRLNAYIEQIRGIEANLYIILSARLISLADMSGKVYNLTEEEVKSFIWDETGTLKFIL
jgi:hypothetical protein